MFGGVSPLNVQADGEWHLQVYAQLVTGRRDARAFLFCYVNRILIEGNKNKVYKKT